MPKVAQPALFDDLPDAPAVGAGVSNALVITAAKLGPEQKLFNQLLTKIEKTSKDMEELKRLSDAHRPERSKKLEALRLQERQANEKMVLFLDQRLQTPKGLSKKQQSDVGYVASALAEMLAMMGPPSPELEAALKRLLPQDDDFDEYDEEEEALDDHEKEHLKGMVSDMLGIEIDDDAAFDSPEAFMAEAMRKMQAGHEAAQQAHQAKQAKRKKSAKQKLAEQETMDADMALRTIYRKLASALHPDREPNEAERARKTQLMGRVNAANDAKDLLTLLRLQLEIEQIDPLAIASMADEKLRHFNRMLKDQHKTVLQEFQILEFRLRDEWQLGYGQITLQSLHASMRSESQRMQRQVEHMQADLQWIQDDKNLKAWAKDQVKMMDAPPSMMEIAMMMHGR